MPRTVKILLSVLVLHETSGQQAVTGASWAQTNSTAAGDHASKLSPPALSIADKAFLSLSLDVMRVMTPTCKTLTRRTTVCLKVSGSSSLQMPAGTAETATTGGQYLVLVPWASVLHTLIASANEQRPLKELRILALLNSPTGTCCSNQVATSKESPCRQGPRCCALAIHSGNGFHTRGSCKQAPAANLEIHCVSYSSYKLQRLWHSLS